MTASAKLIEILVMEGTALLLFDKRGLARLVARLCLLVGLASVFMPLATSLWGDSPRSLAGCIGAYGGFIAGTLFFTMLQARDYVSKSASDA